MIEIKSITKSFGDNKIFNDFSIVIPDKAFKVFAGKSGCGKTTLLNMIGAIEFPDSGVITVNGVNIHKKSNMRKYFSEQVGFLFQNFALIEEETIEENLNYVQKKHRSGRSIDEILNSLGLLDKKNTEVYKLSGGEQQRTALARLMYKKCDIILADEPTGSLDFENTEIVMKILHDFNNQGKTVIMVTHDEKIISEEKDVIRL
ncbi:MAG: ATP-binding cassette domain-containing protein [Oscillospiraceae bacterium]|nr:ATP-binding cassette domain-containing protein [Oscillospiraceae bacterium]MBQ9981061.1 ATP-binding cassette domain-containing protein [Oscillospiraceae bacterium]